jgi:hypothetical protein
MKVASMVAIRWLWARVEPITDGITKELSENRAVLNWIYAAAYLALIFYCAVENQNSHNTAIMTTGGIVGTIFSVYVMAGSYEKVSKMRINSSSSAEPPVEGEDEASD